MNDLKRRAPYFLSDWTDAWDYRVVPATVYMYFAKYDPDQYNFLVSGILVALSLLSLRLVSITLAQP